MTVGLLAGTVHILPGYGCRVGSWCLWVRDASRAERNWGRVRVVWRVVRCRIGWKATRTHGVVGQYLSFVSGSSGRNRHARGDESGHQVGVCSGDSRGVVIGVLMYPILHVCDENVALGYVVARCFEGILLIVGAISLLSQQALTEVANDPTTDVIFAVLQKANFFAYQMAMCILGFGSLPVCMTLLRSRLLPAWLSLWGLVGYAVFLVGAIAEIFGFPIGVMLSAPAGLFEITLPMWLFTKGFARGEHAHSASLT